MLNFYKFIEIIVSLQLLIISTMLPIYIPLSFIDQTSNSFELPIMEYTNYNIINSYI